MSSLAQCFRAAHEVETDPGVLITLADCFCLADVCVATPSQTGVTSAGANPGQAREAGGADYCGCRARGEHRCELLPNVTT